MVIGVVVCCVILYVLGFSGCVVGFEIDIVDCDVFCFYVGVDLMGLL